MKTVNLKAYRAKEITLVNTVENGTKLEIEHKYSYNVNYSRTNTCKGEITLSASAKELSDKFRIKVVMEGIFTFEDGVAKEKIHHETYKELFPYARALITTVTANAGIPPIVMPAIDIEKQSIYRFDGPIMPPKNDNDE